MGFTECPDTKMTATGIPPMTVLANRLQTLEAKMESLASAVEDNHKNTKQVLPDLVVKAMEGRVRIEGQDLFNRRDMQELMDRMEDRILDKITTLSTTVHEATSSGGVDKNSVLEPNALLWTYYWNSSVHPVPQGYVGY
jgi:hypothetical protein